MRESKSRQGNSASWILAGVSIAALLLSSVVLLQRARQDNKQMQPIHLSKVPLPARLGNTDIAHLTQLGLFNPDRSAEPVLAPVSDATQPQQPLPQLTGIIRNGQGASFALFKRADGTQTVTRLNRDIDGWTLVSIASRSVRVARGAEVQTLKLLLPVKPQSAAADPMTAGQTGASVAGPATGGPRTMPGLSESASQQPESR
jgi:hypothetical protein